MKTSWDKSFNTCFFSSSNGLGPKVGEHGTSEGEEASQTANGTQHGPLVNGAKDQVPQLGANC